MSFIFWDVEIYALFLNPSPHVLSRRVGVEDFSVFPPHRKHQKSLLAVRLVYQTGCDYLVNTSPSNVSFMTSTNLISSGAGNSKSVLGGTKT